MKEIKQKKPLKKQTQNDNETPLPIHNQDVISPQHSYVNFDEFFIPKKLPFLLHDTISSAKAIQLQQQYQNISEAKEDLDLNSNYLKNTKNQMWDEKNCQKKDCLNQKDQTLKNKNKEENINVNNPFEKQNLQTLKNKNNEQDDKVLIISSEDDEIQELVQPNQSKNPPFNQQKQEMEGKRIYYNLKLPQGLPFQKCHPQQVLSQANNNNNLNYYQQVYPYYFQNYIRNQKMVEKQDNTSKQIKKVKKEQQKKEQVPEYDDKILEIEKLKKKQTQSNSKQIKKSIQQNRSLDVDKLYKQNKIYISEEKKEIRQQVFKCIQLI